MIHSGIWNVLVSYARQAYEIQTARTEERRLRGDLKRLLSSGEHLIRDIGLDARHVQRWLESESDTP